MRQFFAKRFEGSVYETAGAEIRVPRRNSPEASCPLGSASKFPELRHYDAFQHSKIPGIQESRCRCTSKRPECRNPDVAASIRAPRIQEFRCFPRIKISGKRESRCHAHQNFRKAGIPMPRPSKIPECRNPGVSPRCSNREEPNPFILAPPGQAERRYNPPAEHGSIAVGPMFTAMCSERIPKKRQ